MKTLSNVCVVIILEKWNFTEIKESNNFIQSELYDRRITLTCIKNSHTKNIIN